MSSLKRYKKSGGFVQLLSLIETFGAQKKEKFLEMIEAEDKVWAAALREKMLTLERIFQWPDQVVIEIFKGLPHKNLAWAMEDLKPELKGRMLAFFSASERRRLEEILTQGIPKPEELTANMIKLVELTRKMLVDGDLRPEKFDESMLIPKILKANWRRRAAVNRLSLPAHPTITRFMEPLRRTTRAHPAAAAPSADILQLQRTLGVILKENKTLKDEVRVLREKLDQIRKIA